MRGLVSVEIDHRKKIGLESTNYVTYTWDASCVDASGVTHAYISEDTNATGCRGNNQVVSLLRTKYADIVAFRDLVELATSHDKQV